MVSNSKDSWNSERENRIADLFLDIECVCVCVCVCVSCYYTHLGNSSLKILKAMCFRQNPAAMQVMQEKWLSTHAHMRALLTGFQDKRLLQEVMMVQRNQD